MSEIILVFYLTETFKMFSYQHVTNRKMIYETFKKIFSCFPYLKLFGENP